MKAISIISSIITLVTLPTMAVAQSELPSHRPTLKPGDTIRIYTSTCPLNSDRFTAEREIALQPSIDYSPCINWATNRFILELKHGNKYDRVIAQRINRLQELGGTDVVRQFLDTNGRKFMTALQQQNPDIYQKYSQDLNRLFSSYGLSLQEQTVK